MSQKHLRKKIFVDRKVQGALILKAAGYWMMSLCLVGGLTVLGWIFISPGLEVLVKLREQLPSLVGGLLVSLAASLIVLPVLLIDLTRHTHRFAGPIFRLQRVMRDLADGKPVRPLEFRDGDHWQDLAQAFNQVAERIEHLENTPSREVTPSSEVLEFETLRPSYQLEEPVEV